MNSLKITDFFETDLLHKFYSISNKDMSSGNLDSFGHTLSNNRKKNGKAFQILMYFKYTLNTLVKNYSIFRN